MTEPTSPSTPPLRIAMLITRSDAVGGAQIHVLELSRALRARGHDVCVFAGGDGPFFDLLREHAIPARSIRALGREIHPLYDAAAIAEITLKLRAFAPDLISAHSTKSGWFGRLASEILHIPAVYTIHGWFFHPTPQGLRQHLACGVERLASRQRAPVIAVSYHDRDTALVYHLADPTRLEVVHNAVPARPDLPRAAVYTQPPRLLCVARLEAPKDHDTLLQALAGLKDHPWQLDLIGDGPLRGAVEAQVEALGLQTRVHLRGTRGDVPEQLAKAQIFVLISRSEGFPVSILEAMRAGLPVLASQVGGIAEAVTDGVEGRLVPPADPIALREALHPLLTNPALRARLGGAAYKRFETEFSFEKHVEKILVIYQRAATNPRDAHAHRPR